VPRSVVVAAAGSVDHDQVAELAERTLRAHSAGLPAAPAPQPAPDAPVPDVRFVRKDTEQVHVTLGGLGLQRGDERRYAARVLDAIFGGLSSSRLFQSVREERGLAYSVYSFSGQYSDTGQVGLYVGTRPDNLTEAMKVVNDELERLRAEPATEAELERARENVKARVVLGLESTGARMHRLGGSVLFGLPLLETDQVMARIDAVTLDDVRALVDELWAPGGLSAAGIGPDEDAFRSAVEGVAGDPLVL
jgi:predicted Zn-dependent peptidase